MCKFFDRLAGARRRRTPLRYYLVLAALQGSSMALTNRATQFLNYPTKVLFKSAKAAPLMVVSVLYLGKRYSAADFGAVALLVLGLVSFTLGDVQAAPVFNTEGVALICAALVLDAFLGNVQEKCMRRFGSPQAELVLYTYTGGFALNAALTLLSGEARAAAAFVAAEGPYPVFMVCVMSTAGFIGPS